MGIAVLLHFYIKGWTRSSELCPFLRGEDLPFKCFAIALTAPSDTTAESYYTYSRSVFFHQHVQSHHSKSMHSFTSLKNSILKSFPINSEAMGFQVTSLNHWKSFSLILLWFFPNTWAFGACLLNSGERSRNGVFLCVCNFQTTKYPNLHLDLISWKHPKAKMITNPCASS